MERQEETAAAVAAIIAKLGPNGRRVLLHVAQRLEKGAVEHGDQLTLRPREQVERDRREELLDWLCYDAELELLEKTEREV